MCGARPRYHVLDIDLPAMACVEGSKPLVDVAAERAEMVDIIIQLTANLLLVGFREFVRFGDGLVEGFRWHAEILPHRL
jgi:hypothetical protein